MPYLGRVSVVLAGYEHTPASAEYPHHPNSAREQAAGWVMYPEHAGSVVSATWEFVFPNTSTLVIIWDRGKIAEFILPAGRP